MPCHGNIRFDAHYFHYGCRCLFIAADTLCPLIRFAADATMLRRHAADYFAATLMFAAHAYLFAAMPLIADYDYFRAPLRCYISFIDELLMPLMLLIDTPIYAFRCHCCCRC